jgi:hemerythrin-like domain-containing protein
VGAIMADIQNLQRQHQEIKELVAQLATYDRESIVQEKAFDISLILGKMAGKIKLHLLADDRYVYPSLATHQSTETRAISQKFADEMGNLASAFGQFQENYAGASKIRALAKDFVSDSKIIIKAIMERIEREDKSLYPLLHHK